MQGSSQLRAWQGRLGSITFAMPTERPKGQALRQGLIVLNGSKFFRQRRLSAMG